MPAVHRARRLMLYGLAVVICSLGFSGLALATSGHGRAPRTTKKSSCTLRTVDLAPTAIHGEDFGTLTCTRPFGAGVQHNISTLSPTSPTTGRLRGSSTLFFNTGTVRATFSLRYTISGSSIAYVGTARVSGGTGAYRGIGGSVKLAGSSPDGGTHGTITERIKVKLP